MAEGDVRRATRVFVVLNPVSGRSSGGNIRQTIERHLTESGHEHEIYETTGESDEDIVALVRAALANGFDLMVAVGGDGTVSAVGDALINSEVPLAIIPAGTANVFARELGIPIGLDDACALIAGEYATKAVDVMQVGKQHFILQIGIGIGSLMIRDTSREAKGRFGRLAYMWTMGRSLLGFQPRRFMLVIDGVRHRLSATEIMVANGGVLGVEPFRWGQGISPNDGQIDVCVVSARTWRDYVGVIGHTVTGQQHRSRGLRYFQARDRISVNTKRPLPIQADGEIIGNTPLQVKVIPGALQIAVPAIKAAELQPVAGLPDAVDEQDSLLMPMPGVAQISPEVEAEIAPVEAALKQKLSQIKTPAQARQVADELLAAAGNSTEQDIRDKKGQSPQPAQEIQAQARQPGTSEIANTLLKAAEQVATQTGERREALEQAVQRATNPEQQAAPAPELTAPMGLLREEILRRMQPWQAIDTRLFIAINNLPHTALTNQAMYALTTVMNGGGGWVLGLIAATIPNRKRGLQVLREVVPPLWFATMTIEYPIKFYFRRERPFIDIVKAVSVGKKPGTYSFPSGHSAAAFAGAWLISRHHPRLAGLWYSIAALVGFSRVYLGAHYPGDVLSGAVVGTLIAEAARRVIDASDGDGS